MKRKIYKIIGLLSGLSFLGLGIGWNKDPAAASYLLFITGIFIIIDRTKIIVNEEVENVNLPKM